jgi:hypothetical protein
MSSGAAQPLVPAGESGDVIFAFCEDRSIRVYSMQVCFFLSQPLLHRARESLCLATSGIVSSCLIAWPALLLLPSVCLPFPVYPTIRLLARDAPFRSSCSCCSPTCTHCALLHFLFPQNMALMQVLRGHDSAVHGIYRDEWCSMSDHVVVQTKVWSINISVVPVCRLPFAVLPPAGLRAAGHKAIVNRIHALLIAWLGFGLCICCLHSSSSVLFFVFLSQLGTVYVWVLSSGDLERCFEVRV